MTRIRFAPSIFGSLVVLFLAVAAHGQNQPPSPTEPALSTPKWVEMFDQGEVDPRLKGIQTPRGIKLEIVAQEPAVKYPRQLAFGDDGTLYVLEWTTSGNSRVQSTDVELADGRKATFHRTVKDTRDQWKALQDRDGDGIYEDARIVMDDLELPAGLLIQDGWFYWTSGGRVLRRHAFDAKLLEQLQTAADAKKCPPTVATQDGKWIEQQLVTGLTGVVPFAASGLSASHDGWLYVASGSGDNRAIGWDGSHATVLRSGAIFRMRPDGSQIQEFARGLCNPTGALAFDTFGNAFLADNGIPGKQAESTRLIHAFEGGDYGWLHAKDSTSQSYERVISRPDPARSTLSGGRPGALPSMMRRDGASVNGLLIYYGAAFPKPFQGLLIQTAESESLVRAYLLERDRATFRITSQFDLLRSNGDLFYPGPLVQGPDGAIYIGTGSKGKQGRILRLSWSGITESPGIPLAPRGSWAKIVAAESDELWPLLEHPEGETRQRAANRILVLANRDESTKADVRTRLIALMTDADKPAPVRAAAISAASQLADKPVRESLYRLLTDENPELVRLVGEAIAHSPPTEMDELQTAVEEVEAALSRASDPLIGRGLRLTLGKLAARGVEDAAEWGFEATSVAHGDTFGPKMSRYVFDAHVRALEMVPGAAKVLMLESNLDVALNLPEAEPQERQRLKEFVTLTAEAMRTRELAVFLDALLRGEEDFLARIEAPLEARLIAAYQNVLVDPPINADAVAEWIDKHPGGPVEVELAALETLSIVGTTKTESFNKLADRLLAQPATAILVARSLVAGRLDSNLRPWIKEALQRQASQDKSGDVAKLLQELDK
jgi:putative membrane-bound dehydrogenase-like protein